MDENLLENTDMEIIYDNEWTESSVRQLIKWKKVAQELRDAHDKARKKWTRVKHGLSIPALLMVSTNTIIAGITTLDDHISLRYTTFFISGMVATLNGLQTIFQPGERAEKHDQSSSDYDNLVQYIDYYLNIPLEKRPDIEVLFAQTTASLNFIGEKSPSI